MNLQGRRVIVTGAGMGLGARYAEAVGAAGAAVLVNDISEELATATAERITAAGGRAVAFASDVSDWASAGAMVDYCVAEFGGLDGLVNNAGILGKLRKIYDEQEDSRRLFEVNALGTMYVAAHVSRHMVDSKTRGAIVNVTSGNQCGHNFVSTYGATKGAVASYTYAWARELEEFGVRVNAISPNALTAQHDQVVEQLGYDPEVNHAHYPTQEENAAVVVYLLSDASAALNGQVVRVAHQALTLMSHPLVLDPAAEVTDWSVDNIATVISGEFEYRLQPLGLALGRVDPGRVLL